MADLMTEDDARRLAEKNLGNVVDSIDAALADRVERQSGKVRENFILTDGEGRKSRVLVTTDRVSVFDSVVGTVPFKGQVLDEIAHWWFDKTGILVPNHVIARPSSVVTIAEQCEPLMVEMVVRAYLTGTSSTSIWTHYDLGKREFCGNPIPDHMRKDERLPYVMLTPSTKAAHGDHDVSISADEVLELKLLPGDAKGQKQTWQKLANQSLALFGMGAALADRMGLILVDTKYEFGLDVEGNVILIDEVHTPDSSRYWEKSEYPESFGKGKDPKSLSKQFVRDEVIKQGYDPKKGGDVPKLSDASRVECATRYIMLCQRITGEPFVPDQRPVADRVYAPLDKLGIFTRR